MLKAAWDKKRFLHRRLPLSTVLFVLATLIAGCQPKTPPVLLRVTFLDVGQGDSTVIEGPTGRVMVVDGGGKPGTDEQGGSDPGSRVVVPYLRSRGISSVDLIVPTHPDDDHVQGLIAVASRMNTKGALICGFPGASAPYARLLGTLKNRHIPIYIARRGQTLDLGGGATVEVLHPASRATGGSHSQTNNNSVVLRVVYGKARFLLTGDAEQEAEADMVQAVPDRLAADVYKAGHHGSRWSSTPEFLARVRPRVAIISCGKSNTYGHPHKETLARFATRGVRVFRTDECGAVVVTTDGETLHFAPTVTQ